MSQTFSTLMEFYANSSMFFNFSRGLPLLEETFPVVITRDNAFCVQFCVWQWKSFATSKAAFNGNVLLQSHQRCKKEIAPFFSTVVVLLVANINNSSYLCLCQNRDTNEQLFIKHNLRNNRNALIIKHEPYKISFCFLECKNSSCQW